MDVALSAMGDEVVLGHRLDLISKIFSSLGDSVKIVTLQSPGEPRGHCDTVGLHGSKESIVTLWVLVEPQRPLSHCRILCNQGCIVTLQHQGIHGGTQGPHGTKRPL